MEFKNFLHMRKFSLLNDYYCFVDTEEYLADGLFAQNQVRVTFKGEFGKKDEDYRLIYCRTRKKDKERFLAALEQLKDKMLLFGHPDYGEFCTWIQESLWRVKSEKQKSAEK